MAKHGDKIGKSVILRSGPSTKAWTVNLTSFTGDQITQVRFAGGWKEFATFNGLAEGDFLIFSMTAVSEFEVYVFESNHSTKPFPSRPPNKRPNEFEIARKQAKKHHPCRDDIVSISKSSSAIILSSSSSDGIDSHASESVSKSDISIQEFHEVYSIKCPCLETLDSSTVQQDRFQQSLV